MHGVVPKDGGQIHHLVVTLFNSKGAHTEEAVVRAQLSGTGIVDAPPKYLTPMSIDGLQAVTQHLVQHFPAGGHDGNELPDKPVVL